MLYALYLTTQHYCSYLGPEFRVAAPSVGPTSTSSQDLVYPTSSFPGVSPAVRAQGLRGQRATRTNSNPQEIHKERQGPFLNTAAEDPQYPFGRGLLSTLPAIANVAVRMASIAEGHAPLRPYTPQ